MIDSLTRTVLRTVVDPELFDTDWQLHDLEGPDRQRFRSIVSACRFDRSASLVAIIPHAGRTILVTISDGDPDLVRALLATLSDRAQDACSCVGTVYPLDDPRLAARAVRGAALLTANTFNALGDLPDTFDADGIAYRLIGVSFLTPDDYALWQQEGFGGLMDYYTGIERDIVRFGA